MKIRVRTEQIKFFLPVPNALIGLAAALIPDKAFASLYENIPEPYQALMSKKAVRMLLRECVDVIKENKGLEIIQVQASDGTFVSIVL